MPRATKPSGAADDPRCDGRQATARRVEASRRLRSLWPRLKVAWRGE